MRHNERLPALLWGLVFLFIALTITLALTRVYGFKTAIVDLAAYAQIFWNYSERGQWLVTTPPPFVEQHAYGYHFTPFFYLVYPLYALFPDAVTFQILQACLFGLAAIPIYLAIRALGWDEKIALLWVGCFLVSPFTLNATIWEFHETALSTPSTALIMWGLAARKRRVLLAGCILLLSCKEHFGIAVAGAGLVWAMRTKEWKFGLALAAAGLACLALLLGYVIPSYSPTGELQMLNVAPLDKYGNTLDRFGWLLDPFAKPELIIEFFQNMAGYFGLLMLPLLCAPLLAPLWMLPAAADFLVNSSSAIPLLRSPISYHSAPMMPVLVVAAAAGVMRLRQFKNVSKTQIASFVFGSSLMIGHMLSPVPVPGSLDMWELGDIRFAYPEKDRQAVKEIQALITPEEHVSAMNNVGIFFSDRRWLYMFPYKTDGVDAIVLRPEYVYALKFRDNFDKALVDGYHDTIANPEWGVAYWNAPWLLLKKGAPRDPAVLAEIDAAWEHYMDESKLEALKAKHD